MSLQDNNITFKRQRVEMISSPFGWVGDQSSETGGLNFEVNRFFFQDANI